jgi:hypothetical protein
MRLNESLGDGIFQPGELRMIQDVSESFIGQTYSHP